MALFCGFEPYAGKKTAARNRDWLAIREESSIFADSAAEKAV
jgi:hypothetical protein